MPSMLLVLLGGCATLPDLAPYADSSVQLREAVAASGRATVQELRLLRQSNLSPEDQERLDASIDKLEADWAVRVVALSAVVAYSESLQAIADAGSTGGEATSKVADSLKSFATTVGVAAPAGQAVGAATDLAKFIYGRIAEVRAEKALGKSLRLADPAVLQLVSTIQKDLEDVKGTALTALALQESLLKTTHQTELAFRKARISERQALYASLGEKASLDEVDAQKLQSLAVVIQQTEEWYGPLQAKLNEVRVRRSAMLEIIEVTRFGLDSWANAHTELAEAVEDERSRGPSMQAVISSAKEIKALIERIRTS